MVLVRVGRSRTSRRGYIRSTYQADEIDALAAYCGALDRCYLLPVAMVAGRHTVQLRISPARNSQRAAINSAAAYELGAVAQLAERSDGIRKVEGSNPSSSTPSKSRSVDIVFPDYDGFSDLNQVVGMDEFDAKLAVAPSPARKLLLLAGANRSPGSPLSIFEIWRSMASRPRRGPIRTSP